MDNYHITKDGEQGKLKRQKGNRVFATTANIKSEIISVYYDNKKFIETKYKLESELTETFEKHYKNILSKKIVISK